MLVRQSFPRFISITFRGAKKVYGYVYRVLMYKKKGTTNTAGSKSLMNLFMDQQFVNVGKK